MKPTTPSSKIRMQINLDEVSYFEHKSSCTIWLGSRSQELLAVQERLQEAFPNFHELSHDPERNIRNFAPHLSLGQWPHKQVEQSLEASTKH